ncbi:unnamed protein product [Clonostachys rosea]|uniref:Uncharacterized protein n=1 Tax=Bionectria ochroleuca TaxID=29856 RepID=A0ABY6U2V8_BIOOC|nr:unnamed protein product [Clonostachys rosea]
MSGTYSFQGLGIGLCLGCLGLSLLQLLELVAGLLGSGEVVTEGLSLGGAVLLFLLQGLDLGSLLSDLLGESLLLLGQGLGLGLSLGDAGLSLVEGNLVLLGELLLGLLLVGNVLLGLGELGTGLLQLGLDLGESSLALFLGVGEGLLGVRSLLLGSGQVGGTSGLQALVGLLQLSVLGLERLQCTRLRSKLGIGLGGQLVGGVLALELAKGGLGSSKLRLGVGLELLVRLGEFLELGLGLGGGLLLLLEGLVGSSEVGLKLGGGLLEGALLLLGGGGTGNQGLNLGLESLLGRIERLLGVGHLLGELGDLGLECLTLGIDGLDILLDENQLLLCILELLLESLVLLTGEVLLGLQLGLELGKQRLGLIAGGGELALECGGANACLGGAGGGERKEERQIEALSIVKSSWEKRMGKSETA